MELKYPWARIRSEAFLRTMEKLLKLHQPNVLYVESLDATLKQVTFDMEHLQLWKNTHD